MSTSQIPYRSNRSAGTDVTRSVNDLPAGYVKRNLNRYDLSKRVLTTGRFAEVQVVDCLECIPNMTVNTSLEVNLMMNRPLPSPLMSQVFMHRMGAYCASQAIYPESWETLKSIPLHDSEAPADARSFFTGGNPSTETTSTNAYMISFIKKAAGYLNTGKPEKAAALAFAVYCCSLMFSSNGELRRMGCALFRPYIFDYILDAFYKSLPAESAFSFVENLSFVDLDQLDQYFKDGKFDFRNFATSILDDKAKPLYTLSGLTTVPRCNLEPLFGVRLAENEFFSNDQVDDIFDSKRWYQLFKTFMTETLLKTNDYSSFGYFIYEGSQVPYDPCSNHWLTLYFKYLDEALSSSVPTFDVNDLAPIYLLALPFYAMKVGDYFTGARLSPLAVGSGDYTEVTTGQGVSTIGINQNLLMLRLRQYINRVGSRAVEQAKALFGIAPSEGNTRPKFIFHHKSALGKNLVVQTGADPDASGKSPLGSYAMNMTANPDPEANKFSFLCDDFGYYFSFVFFDTKAFYELASQRLFFKTDKYDFFDPMLQNFGDDQIFQAELSCRVTDGDVPFGFTSRYNDYRQRYDIVTGAFLSDNELKSWYLDITTPDIATLSKYTLNSKMLRLLPSYFDPLFKSAVPSFIKSFHYILECRIACDVLSPVSIDPNILF